MRLLASIILAGAAALNAHADQCAPFEWGKVTAGELEIAEGAIIVKVSISGVGEQIPLQLDSGSPATELYGEAVTASVAAVGTQTRTVKVEGWAAPEKHIPVAVRPASGSPGETVGTLGADFLGDGFILDLEHQRICILDAVASGEFDRFQPLTTVNGSPVFEALEDGIPIRLLLDTGSSGFTLLSTPSLSSTIRTAVADRQIEVPSFGRMLSIGELKASQPMTVMGSEIMLETVYAFTDPDIEAMLSSAGLSGLMGLRPFKGGALVFDFSGERLGFGHMPAPGVSGTSIAH